MHINLFTPKIQYRNNYPGNFVKYPNLAPLQYDTVTFGAMKKKEFVGVDLAVVEKFKAPIEKFNNNGDLENWVENKIENIKSKDYGGRQEETTIQRNAMLKEWFDYVTEENDAYSKSLQLIVLSAITKDLEPDNDTIPPVLNKGVLADCAEELKTKLTENPKLNFDFNKMYRNKLQAYYLADTNTGESETEWVIIPSYYHDPENFEHNVGKLKTLSHKNWCTKSFNAEPYLHEGDFHIYLENGQPKLGVRFVDDEIAEIQGEKNNGKISPKYLDTAEEHISSNNLKLSLNVQSKIIKARILKEKIENVPYELGDAIKNNDVEKILKYFGINIESKDEKGYLTISYYMQPYEDYTYADLGIDETKLFKKVKYISGCADFSNSQITSLDKLETIGGSANFSNSKITDLGKLTTIGGFAYFNYSQVTNLCNLTTIGSDVFIAGSLLKPEDFVHIKTGKIFKY
ncbi:MAG: hypothetical protein KIC80_10080 [Brachyspira sp.]|nr:hypothetical protein [Brachyspira sp.]